MASIALHGLVDLAQIKKVCVYVALLLPIRYTKVDKLCFAIASVLHFAQDANLAQSLTMHALLFGLHVRGRTNAAVRALVGYFLFDHIPRLFIRAIDEQRNAELAILSASVLIALLAPERVCRSALGAPSGAFVLSPRLQRVITCHAVANLLFDAHD